MDGKDLDADMKKRIKRREYKKRQKLKAQQKKCIFLTYIRTSSQRPLSHNRLNLSIENGLRNSAR